MGKVIDQAFSKGDILEDLRLYPFNKLPAEDPVVIVHSSLKSIGYVIGGAETVVRALLEWVGGGGTLVFPAYSYSASDPEQWRYPPVAPHLVEKVRKNIPPFDPILSPIDTGAIPSAASRFPGALRSSHPNGSIIALGKNAKRIVSAQRLENSLLPDGPLGQVYELDGWVLSIGTDLSSNSSMHLAERWARKGEGLAHLGEFWKSRVPVDTPRGREWVLLEKEGGCSTGFIRIEPILRRRGVISYGRIGQSYCQFMPQRGLVDETIKILDEDPLALLCSDPDCPQCAPTWRKYGSGRQSDW
ncbi:MAG: AAC(3) family N-acetyltransferase [Candidatus Brockarchaeota archaeon]|nr:AAC(3) family N-acetyltransferase [Candidatus Brockarchaeota archaeon]